MSSSGDFDHDSYDYGSYILQNYEQGKGPPLIMKKSRIIVTVVQGDIETLKSLLDSSRWYNVRDRSGYDLLEIAILLCNRDVFDFLLSLEDYPFDAVDGRGKTPLQIAISVGRQEEYFAMELIKKGADIHVISPCGDPLLHVAVNTNFSVKIAELLIEKGADINEQNDIGDTPLHKMLIQLEVDSEVLLEGVSMFLYYGADISIRNLFGRNAFEIALRMLPNENVLIIQENLLYLTIDEYSHYTLPCDILLTMISVKSPLCYKIIESVADATISPEEINVDLNYCDGFLFAIDTEYLEALLEKFSHVLSEFFLTYSLLFESDLLLDVLEFLRTTRLLILIERFSYDEVSSAATIDICHYLLTYGIAVYESDLEAVYSRHGYCDLFKILLHMDIKKEEEGVQDIFPAVIYDVTIEIEKVLEGPHLCSECGLNNLLDYFAFPKLKNFCLNSNIESLTAKAQRLPDVPLLIELARNASRKYLCRRFNITTSKWFYSILNWLPISTVHRKIMSFETKLYC